MVMDGCYPDPEAIRDGWFHTGDMAVLDDEGYLLIVDRSKDNIISGGENFSSVEIEDWLFANPKVFERAVVAVPDDKGGEVPKALVVLQPGQTATEEEIIATVKRTSRGSKCPNPSNSATRCPKAAPAKS